MFDSGSGKQLIFTVFLVQEARLREELARLCGDRIRWRTASDDYRRLVVLSGGDEEPREGVYSSLRGLFGEKLVRLGDVPFVEDLVGLFKKKKLTLSSAESCTGGLIAKLLTDIAGSSAVYWGGFVTYDNRAKQALLGVTEKCLAEYGAVSIETVREMASGALKRSGTDYAVAVSGVAGPGGGSPEKPVGTVCIGVYLKDGLFFGERFFFGGSRERIRRLSAFNALFILESLALKGECLDMNIAYDYI